MSFIYAGDGAWSGSGDLNDQSQWFVVDSETGQLVPAEYPSGGADFTGGGTLSAAGDFPVVGLQLGDYVIVGDLSGSTLTVSPFTGNDATLILAAGTNISGGTINTAWQVGTTAFLAVEGAMVNTLSFTVGDSGSATLQFSSGSINVSDYLTIGAEVGGSGNAVITGNSSTLTTGATVAVGGAGMGTLSVEDGATVTAAGLDVADQASSTGEVTIDNSTVNITGELNLAGSAQVNIQNNATVTAGNVGVADQSGGTSDLIISSASLNITSGGIDAGYAGNGTLSVESGASVTGDFLNIGHLSGSVGSVDVTGAGTTVDMTAGPNREIAVGLDGTGSLTIEDQATVTTNNMGVGVDANGGTPDTLDVNDAALTVNQFLTIAGAGSATATIEAGASVSAGGLILADQSGSSANLTINNATVNIDGPLTAGMGGTTIDLSGNGSLDVGSNATAFEGAIDVGSSDQMTVQGSATIDGTLIDGGLVTVNGNLNVSNPIVVSGGIFELGSAGTVGSSSIIFAPNGSATLRIDSTTMPTNVISGLDTGDTIDLSGVNFGSLNGATLFETNNVLQIVENGSKYDLQLDPSQDFSGDDFELSSDGKSGTNVTFSPAAVAGGITINATVPVTGYSTSTYPYNGVVYIQAYFPSDPVPEKFTGFIIGPHTILTVSHGFWNSQFASQEATAVTISGTFGSIDLISGQPSVDAVNGQTSINFGQNGVVHTGTIGLATSPGAEQNDYAVVDVSQTLPFYDSIPIGSYSGGAVNITGYPSTDAYPLGTQFNIIGDTLTSSQGVLISDAETTFGYSGGPVWVYDGSSVEAVGILAGGLSAQSFIVPITSALSNAVNKWSRDDASLGTTSTNSSGNQTVGFDEIASNLFVTDTGILNILAGGAASGIVLANGGVENVRGSDSGATINDGGYQYVFAGGTATDATLTDPGIQVVSAGGTAISATLFGGEQDVYGTASGTDVESGGLQIVESGGNAIGTFVDSGGTIELLGGAIASDPTFSSGGILEIASGYTLGDYQVGAGITLQVGPGGTATGTVVDSGGTIELLGGASASGTTISVGGTLEIGSGYTVDDYEVGGGLILEVASGGGALGTVVDFGGTLELLGGATETGTVINDGGFFEIGCGYAVDDFTVANGVTLAILSGGTASGTLVSSGGFEFVNSGGIDFAATILEGASLAVSSGGAVTSATVVGNGMFDDPDGGSLAVLGGATSATLVISGGFENVQSGGTDVGTTIGSAGLEIVSAGGTVISATVIGNGAFDPNGGLLGLHGGTANSTVVSSGGLENIKSGGTDFDARVFGGGEMLISSGGTSISATVIGSGTSDSATEVLSGGIASDTTVSDTGKLIVRAGGIAFDTIVDSTGGFGSGNNGGLKVSSGGTASETTVNSGGIENVFSDGTDSGTTVNGGGLLIVSSGGTAASATLFGGEQEVYGTASNTTIDRDGTEYVSPGGIAADVAFGAVSGTLALAQPGGLSGTVSGWLIGDTIDFFGTSVTSATISGTTLTVTVSGAATFDYQIAGQEASTSASLQSDGAGGTDVVLVWTGSGAPPVENGEILVVSGGQTSSGLVVLSGGIVDVLSGGTTIDTVVSGGGIQIDAGTASNTVIDTGGIENVISGGIAGNTTVSSGSELVISSGGLADPTTINGAGLEVISAGGTDDGAQINGGEQDVYGTASGVTVFTGSQVVEAGGTASGTTVDSGGDLIVSSGGAASGTNLSSGGSEAVYFGGTDFGTTISSGGYETVSAGGLVVSASVVDSIPFAPQGGNLSLLGGTASATVISTGGYEAVSSGGTDFGATILSGASEDVFSGGRDSGTTILSGGALSVSAGGAVFSASLVGGYLGISGGTASGTVVSSGGFESVNSGGSDFGATILESASLVVSSGGSVTSATVIGNAPFDINGGFLGVGAGGIASGTVISNGGGETVKSGGMDIGATISSGGDEVVLSGGSVISATIIGSGAFDPNGGVLGLGGKTSAGGTATGTVISIGGLEVVRSGGQDFSGTVLGGGEMLISSGGQSISATVIGSGTSDSATEVLSGGTASDTTLLNTGKLVVRSGGAAFDTIVDSTGGFGSGSNGGLKVSAGGVGSDTTINSGGIENVFSGGTDSGATVNRGGLSIVSSGGAAASATLAAGEEDVYGTASNTTIENGGTEYVFSGGTANGVTFAGSSGALKLESPSGLIGTVSSWQVGDVIDFVSTSVTSATINGATLTITTSGGQSFGYQLSGQQANDADLQSDGAGGTDVILDVEQTPTLSVALSGNAVEGATLTATPRLTTEGDNSVADVTYQWQRNGVAINGATGATYVVGEADEGTSLSVLASFTDDTGQSVQATSNATGAVTDAAPTVTTPVIIGTAQEGQTLTASASAGQADNAVTYQWFSSADGYTNPIGSGAGYQVKEGDEGHQIEVVATVINDDGATITATSSPTAAVADALPTVTVPMISGIAQEGQILTASASTGQTDNPVSYAWYSSADNYTNSIGSGVSYQVQEADEGNQIEVVATATNDNGITTSATSNATTVVTDAPPTVTTPTIFGIAQEGQILTASASAGQSDNTIAYQWIESSDGGITFQNISGATSASYVVQESEEGDEIEVTATVTNDNGATESATSAATAAVLDTAPTVTTPVISGTAQAGQTLSASASAGQSDNTIAYQWVESNDSGLTFQNIAGATGATYLVLPSDEGDEIEVVATATNDNGATVSAASAPTGAVLDAQPTHWESAVSGDWTSAADWTAGVPNAGLDAIVDATPASYVVTISTAASVHSLLVNYASDSVGFPQASVNVTGSLTVATTLFVQAGGILLSSTGSIIGGTLSDSFDSGGTSSGLSFIGYGWYGGTLSGVTYDGQMLFGDYWSVHITNGLTVNNGASTGPGAVDLIGANAAIYFEGNQTFDRATINLGSAAINLGDGVIDQDDTNNSDFIYEDDTNNNGAVLTLGPNLIVNWSNGGIESTSDVVGDGIVNNGTINYIGTSSDSSNLNIDSYDVTNGGTISGGGNVFIYAQSAFSNAKGAAISASELSIDSNFGGFINDGSISATNLVLIDDYESFVNNGTIIAAGSPNGTNKVEGPFQGGSSFDNEGTISVTNYDTLQLVTQSVSGDVNNGIVSASSGGRLVFYNYGAALGGAGAFEIGDGGIVELATGVLANAVSFSPGAVGTLQLDGLNLLTGAISGLALGDAIAFANTVVSTFSLNGDTLSVNFTNGQSEDLVLAAPLATGESLAPKSYGASGTELVVTMLSVAVGGTAQEGQTLTAVVSGGTASGYQWQFSTDGGTTWQNLTGATVATYVVQETDEANLLRVEVTGSGDIVASAPTTAVTDAAPTVTVPTITGIAEEGQTLTASASAGQSDNPVTYQWFSSADNYTNVIGSGATYQVKEGDEGNQIEVVATATNDSGVAFTQTSSPTTAVTDAAPTVAVAIDSSDVNLVSSTATVTFTFSEAPTAFTLADTTAIGGTLGALTLVNPTTYTATFSAAAGYDSDTQGPGAVSLTSGSWQDDDGNPGSGGSTAFTVDTVTPTVSVTTSNSDVDVANGTATIRFAFSEAPVSFTLADTTAVGGTLSGLAGSGTTYTATFTGAADIDINDASVSVTVDSWQENNGNPGLGNSTPNFTVDTVPSGVTVTTSNADVNLANHTATITFIFTSAPTGFTLDDTTAVGGTLSHLAGSGTTYTATLTAAANTNINDATVSVKPGSWGAGGSTPDFTVDTITPTVSLSTSNTDVNVANDSATISFAFSEAPVSFTLADTTAVGGTLSNLTGSGTTYTAIFTANADTSITNAKVSVTKNSWQEVNGNPGAAGSTSVFTADTITPTVKVTTSNKDVNIADPTATITFAFSEAPVSFTLADTTAVGGTLSNLTGSGTTYTATFTGAGNTFDIDDATVSVTAGSWQENNGNLGLGGSTPDFTVDTVTPTVSVSTSNTDVNVLNKTATITFTFSAAPASFTLADSTAVGGTLSHLTAETTSGPAAIYTATFTGAANTTIDDASVSVTAGSWKDAGSNPGAGGSTGSFAVDTVTPTVSVTTSSSDVNVANGTATVSFVFSEAPVSFTLADTKAVGGTLSNLTGSGTTYTAIFTGNADTSVTDASVSVTAGSWDEVNGNAGSGGSTGSFVVDTIAPTVTGVVSSVTTGEVTTGKILTIKLDTSEAVNVTGSPVLLLNDGGTASYEAAQSTTKTLVFDYTVASSDVTTDLVVSGIELPSASSIEDLAGNTANLSGAGANIGLKVNTKSTGTAGPSGGNFTISGSTDLELFGASTANVTFAPGGTGTLKLDASSQFNGTVAGLALGNYLDLADIAFGSSTSLGYAPNGNNTGGTLSATDGSHIADIALLGQYMASSFVAASDGHGGTLITDPPLAQPQPLAQAHA